MDNLDLYYKLISILLDRKEQGYTLTGDEAQCYNSCLRTITTATEIDAKIYKEAHDKLTRSEE